MCVHVFAIADLKNKKASLETSVQRAQRDVEKLAEPQVVAYFQPNFNVTFRNLVIHLASVAGTKAGRKQGFSSARRVLRSRCALANFPSLSPFVAFNVYHTGSSSKQHGLFDGLLYSKFFSTPICLKIYCKYLKRSIFYQQTRLHRKLRERRAEALDQLKTQSEDIKKIETAIFSSGQRLGAVLKENHR